MLAAIAFNLTRAAGCLAGAFHAKATGATIRAQLIGVPARLARTGHRPSRPGSGHLTLHLPQNWPWEPAATLLFQHAFNPALDPPPAAA